MHAGVSGYDNGHQFFLQSSSKMTLPQETPSTVEGVEIVCHDVIPAPGIPVRAAPGSPQGLDEPVPIAAAAGIPLRVQRKPGTCVRNGRYRICRIMSVPRIGLCDESWADFPQSPSPVLMFRTDGVPFTVADFEVLDDFEMAMLDDGPRDVSRRDWVSWCPTSGDVRNSPLKIEMKFRKGATGRVTGLQSAPELNGSEGVVKGGAHYTCERVGVLLPEPYGLKAVKVDDLEVI